MLQDEKGNDILDNFVQSSEKTRKKIKAYVEAKGYDNVKRCIYDVIPQESEEQEQVVVPQE